MSSLSLSLLQLIQSWERPILSRLPVSRKGVHVSVISANTDDMRMEINLIGRTVDEATDELEKYLDRSFLAGLPKVRVIHGHGAGILRRGVREFLKSHPHVATIAEAPQNDGGQGATLVELRQ